MSLLAQYTVRFAGDSATEEYEEYMGRLIYSQGATCIAGIDEVGRGALFGDVVVACVSLPTDHKIEGIYDSKKITEKKRLRLDKEIAEIASIGIGVATHEEIDKYNIFQATHMAARRAYTECAAKCDIDLLLCDGGLDIRKHINIPARSIVKGDCFCESIGAASIIAKVFRDNQMEFYHDIWPEYGLKEHKGYGTKKHREAIEKYGVTPVHRQSFKPCKKAKKRTTCQVD
jgi:ribonuclease HII